MNNPKFNHIYSVDKPTLNDFYKQYQKADSKNLDILETLEVLKNHFEKEHFPKQMSGILDGLEQEWNAKDYYAAMDRVKYQLLKNKLIKNKPEILSMVKDIAKIVAKKKEEIYKMTAEELALMDVSEYFIVKEKAYHNLEELKDKIAPEIFNLFVVFQVDGIVQADGWGIGLFGNTPQFVPYVFQAFQAVGLDDLANDIQSVIHAFPSNTTFNNQEDAYIDVLNFMENPRRKITNPELLKYTKEEREKYHLAYIHALYDLEETLQLQADFWDIVKAYFHQNINQVVYV
ncbi:MAG: hypothetical protein ACPG6V_08725 [Flavobacteriales bacterium]